MSRSELIRIAGITLRVRYADESLRRPLSETMSRFAVVDDGGHADVDIVIEAMNGPLPRPGKLLFDSGAVWRAYEIDGGFRIDCHSGTLGDVPYKVALFNHDLSSARVLVRFEVFNDEMHALDYPLDEVMVAHLLGRGRGVELHSCGIIDREGRGQLFVGQSGAGKSTTARVWLAEGHYEIVSDDRVILRFVDGEWRMYGTPWHGEAALSSAASAPLAAIHILVQASRTELVALPRAEAAAKLFSCAFPPFYDAEALFVTLGILDRIVAEVPVRALRFVPDRSVLDCIQSAA
ncbi:MAG: hypothetical protein QOC81_3528 [Thermoanaerobaculia bacterium]|jgi:hypothetical protein|nr:hypothetical protein [Thermoanaerobaculia bacterium]